jgi:hypothetical protein
MVKPPAAARDENRKPSPYDLLLVRQANAIVLTCPTSGRTCAMCHCAQERETANGNLHRREKELLTAPRLAE